MVRHNIRGLLLNRLLGLCGNAVDIALVAEFSVRYATTESVHAVGTPPGEAASGARVNQSQNQRNIKGPTMTS